MNQHFEVYILDFDVFTDNQRNWESIIGIHSPQSNLSNVSYTYSSIALVCKLFSNWLYDLETTNTSYYSERFFTGINLLAISFFKYWKIETILQNLSLKCFYSSNYWCVRLCLTFLCLTLPNTGNSPVRLHFTCEINTYVMYVFYFAHTWTLNEYQKRSLSFLVMKHSFLSGGIYPHHSSL